MYNLLINRLENKANVNKGNRDCFATEHHCFDGENAPRLRHRRSNMYYDYSILIVQSN